MRNKAEVFCSKILYSAISPERNKEKPVRTNYLWDKNRTWNFTSKS